MALARIIRLASGAWRSIDCAPVSHWSLLDDPEEPHDEGATAVTLNSAVSESGVSLGPLDFGVYNEGEMRASPIYDVKVVPWIQAGKGSIQSYIDLIGASGWKYGSQSSGDEASWSRNDVASFGVTDPNTGLPWTWDTLENGILSIGVKDNGDGAYPLQMTKLLLEIYVNLSAPDKPTNLTATCIKESVPEIPGFSFSIISGGF